ncbi:flagellar filament capping protein FliD, partial [Klebsiella pneumoniae]|nr:flagellar filament capping protein FliD [Klebsiella pneumoniae]
RNLLGGFGSASSTFNTLSSIGLRFQKDGSLQVDDTALSAAVQNPTELKKALSNVDLTSPVNNGFFKKLSDWEAIALGTTGSL